MQMRTKAALGRSHKRSDWVLWLYPRLLEAFECCKQIGVKFLCRLLLELANTILIALDPSYTIHSRDLKDDVFLTQKLNDAQLGAAVYACP